ncbi:ABC transporter substrate-binding protein [Janibacter sp. G1551]|uniref:ABC transporter substrate-binding protein n=1 Tax=Janibacter sp. G1551 TaxID=3420440 RepID=UPI003D044862
MRRTRFTIALAGLAALGLTACGGGGTDPLATDSDTSSAASGGAAGGGLVVGSADFPESELLAEIYAGALNAKGINATTKPNIGAREIYLKALEDGSIDLVPEYTGALALYYDKAFDKTDPEEVYTELEGVLPDDLTVLEKSAAEDNDSLVITKEKAAELGGASTIEDLAQAEDLTLGAPAEFKTRAQGIVGLKETYGFEPTFKALKGQQLVQFLKNGQVDVANIFSTDPAILENDFVALEDTKKLFGSQNVVPLVTKEAATEDVTAALDAVSAELTTEELTALLTEVTVEKKDAADVAASFLAEAGLS